LLESAPIDFRALAALVGEDDPAELRSIALEYLATSEPTYQRARRAIERRNPVELAEASHAGKGSALSVCAGPLAEAWRLVEVAAQARDLEQAAGHMNELEARLRGLGETLRNGQP
jgi:hypothetical protein